MKNKMINEEKKVILNGFYIVEDGEQIGYGPSRDVMRSDTLFIEAENLRNSNSFPGFRRQELSYENIDQVKELIEESYKNEKEDMEMKSSVLSVIHGKQTFRDFFDKKIKSVTRPQNSSPEKILERKYKNLREGIDSIQERYTDRQENGYEPSRNNDLDYEEGQKELASNTLKEGKNIERKKLISSVNDLDENDLDGKGIKNIEGLKAQFKEEGLEGSNQERAAISAYLNDITQVEAEMNTPANKSKNKSKNKLKG